MVYDPDLHGIQAPGDREPDAAESDDTNHAITKRGRKGKLTFDRPTATDEAIDPDDVRPKIATMMKRIAASVLWFYAGWVAGAMLAFVLGISPILGTAAAALIAGDPRGIIWTKTPKTTRPASPSTSGRALGNPA